MILELLADAGLGLGGLDLDRRLRPPGQGPLGPIVVGVLLAIKQEVRCSGSSLLDNQPNKVAARMHPSLAAWQVNATN